MSYINRPNFEHIYNKYKTKYLLSKAQYGGVNKNILFGCTSLSEDSTLSKYFDYINYAIDNIIPENVKKNAYFVYKTPSFWDELPLIKDNYLENKLNEKEFNVIKYENNYVFDANIINFIEHNKTRKFDIIVFTQCNDFIGNLGGNEINKEFMFASFEKIEMLHKQLLQNLITLYNSLPDSGILMNMYFAEKTSHGIMLDFKCSISYISFKIFISHILLYMCFLLLFSKNNNRKHLYNKI